MSEQNPVDAQALEIAEFLGVRAFYCGTGTWEIGGATMDDDDPLWSALLHLARQPRGLPAEVPEGHERVRIGVWRTNSGNWGSGVMGYPWSVENLPDAIVTVDVPLPRAVEIVGSVEP